MVVSSLSDLQYVVAHKAVPPLEKESINEPVGKVALVCKLRVMEGLSFNQI